MTNNLNVISKSSHVIKVAIADNKWWYGNTFAGEKFKLIDTITEGGKNDRRISDLSRIIDLMKLLNNPRWVGKRSRDWAEIESLAADIVNASV